MNTCAYHFRAHLLKQETDLLGSFLNTQIANITKQDAASLSEDALNEFLVLYFKMKEFAALAAVVNPEYLLMKNLCAHFASCYPISLSKPFKQYILKWLWQCSEKQHVWLDSAIQLDDVVHFFLLH